MPVTYLTTTLMLGLWLIAPPVQAYVGPGAGAGTIAVVLGVLASIFMAFFALLWYPVKRLIRKRRAAKVPPPGDT